MSKINTFFMFDGRAQEAIQFYLSLFEESELLSMVRYGPGEVGAEGTVQHAVFQLAGQVYMAIDSNVEHGFSFTPAISLFVTCESEQEVDQLFGRLSEGGQVMMPLDAYPFSPRFGWVSDRFGVSWQLNLAAAS